MARHRLSRDQVIRSFGPDLQPVLDVEPGDVVTFETNDCFTGQIRTEHDLVTSIDMTRPHLPPRPSDGRPVRRRGMHAAMGDGEICFTGVEIAGEVDVRFDVAKGKQATRPVTELPGRWVPHASPPDYTEGLQLVSEEAAKLLVDEHGFTIEDAFIFLSVACDTGVAQACKPAEGFGTIARFSIPKLAACPCPFRP